MTFILRSCKIYSWIFSHNIKQTVFDIWHVNSQCCVAPSLSHDSYYLEPVANILLIPKRHDFFKTSEQLYIELAHWNWITDSLVFSAPSYDVISWLFLRYLFALSLSCIVFCCVLLCCAVTRGTNPWPTVLVFLLSQGWRSIPFKCSQL